MTNISQQRFNQRLAEFATEVGKDYRELNQLLTTLQQQHTPQSAITQQIQQAVSQLKNELMGGELDSHLDTLKELGDKLKALDGDDSIKGAILQKFSDISQKITALEQQHTALSELNLLQLYQQAKEAS